MNIAHIVFSFNAGGIENLLVDIFNNWAFEDRLLLCIVNNSKNEDLIDKIFVSENRKVICMNRQPGQSKIKYIVRINRMLSNFRPDIIHFHNNNILKFCLPIKLMHPTWKLVLHIHDTNTYINYTGFDVLLHKLVLSAIIVISSSVKNEVEKKEFPREKIYLVYNGVDPKKFLPHDRRSRTLDTIICVARLYPLKKGQDVLIRAVAELKKVRKSVMCELVGEVPANNLEYRSGIKELINKLHIEKNVVLLGNRNDVPALLSKADVFVLPSRYEGFGISIIEAMFAGVPVIASAVDGPKEIIQNGRNGFLFESENVHQLTDRICFVLENDTTELTDYAYRTALEKYSIQTMISKLRKIYSSTI